MFSSSLAKFEKLNKYLKDCFVCYDMYLTFNDLFHDSEEKIWSICSIRGQMIFANFLKDLQSISEEEKDIILDNIQKMGAKVNSIFTVPEETEASEEEEEEEHEKVD